MTKKNNVKKVEKTHDEYEAAKKYAPKNPAKTTWGKTVIVLLCAGMVLLPLIAVIIALINK